MLKADCETKRLTTSINDPGELILYEDDQHTCTAPVLIAAMTLSSVVHQARSVLGPPVWFDGT